MFAPRLKNLKDLRTLSLLTQAELADRAGVSVRTVGAAERCACRPKAATAQKIAAGLGVEPHELWRLSPGTDAAAVSAAVDELVAQTLTGEDGATWVEDQLIKEFRYRLDDNHGAADAVWRNVESHAGFYVALSSLMRIVGWASACGNTALVAVIHDAVRVICKTEWHPLHAENGEGDGRGPA